MGDAATRFDRIVTKEERKKKTNAFVKSNSTLKGVADKVNADLEDDFTLPEGDAPMPQKTEGVQKVENALPEKQEGDAPVPQKAEEVQKAENALPEKRESAKKNLVLDKTGRLDLKALINAKDGDSKSYSLYLKEKTYKELEKLAKSQNVSVSRALNDILDSIL